MCREMAITEQGKSGGQMCIRRHSEGLTAIYLGCLPFTRHLCARIHKSVSPQTAYILHTLQSRSHKLSIYVCIYLSCFIQYTQTLSHKHEHTATVQTVSECTVYTFTPIQFSHHLQLQAYQIPTSWRQYFLIKEKPARDSLI